MVKYIDADALYMELVKMKDFGELTAKKAIRVVKNAPAIDAVPIEFIEKRISELKKLNEYTFVANGGYTSPSDYEQWGLERLIRDWREQNV